MAAIKSYKVVTAECMQELVDAVNAAIEEGWQPQGGVNIDGIGRQLQAMVKTS